MNLYTLFFTLFLGFPVVITGMHQPAKPKKTSQLRAELQRYFVPKELKEHLDCLDLTLLNRINDDSATAIVYEHPACPQWIFKEFPNACALCTFDRFYCATTDLFEYIKCIQDIIQEKNLSHIIIPQHYIYIIDKRFFVVAQKITATRDYSDLTPEEISDLITCLYATHYTDCHEDNFFITDTGIAILDFDFWSCADCAIKTVRDVKEIPSHCALLDFLEKIFYELSPTTAKQAVQTILLYMIDNAHTIHTEYTTHRKILMNIIDYIDHETDEYQELQPLIQQIIARDNDRYNPLTAPEIAVFATILHAQTNSINTPQTTQPVATQAFDAELQLVLAGNLL